MVATSEDDLICDFAETYHIYNYRALPVKLSATLASGLRDNSRIKLKLKNEEYSPEIIIGAMIADRLAILQHGIFHIKEKPKLLTEELFGKSEDENANRILPDIYSSPEEFFAQYSASINKER